MAASFAGPLPPPSILASYDAVCPGSAERILAMAERQSAHRQELERIYTNANVEEMHLGFREAQRGQVFAFLISVAFLAVGAYVSVHGQPWIGVVLGGMGLTSIAASFIEGRAQKNTVPEPKPAPAPKKRKRKS
ncbi:MAG: DUF2335 domain-containing protein [Bryobacteraceae bacterium]